jgi:hypothetical protein
MQRKGILRAALAGVTICGILISALILGERIRIDREERERHFVSVHFVAMEAAMEQADDAPKTLDELMERYAGGPESLLLKPFRHGLAYRPTNGGFELAESQREFVSLLRRDRLVATDHDWPHWESSGKKVWKFPGQTIPPNYLKSNAEQAETPNRR